MKVNLGGSDPRPDNFSRFFIATAVKLIDPLVTIDNEILSHHLFITILTQRRSVLFLLLPTHRHFSNLHTMATTLPPKSTGSDKLDAVVQNVSAQSPKKLSGLDLYSRFVS